MEMVYDLHVFSYKYFPTLIMFHLYIKHSGENTGVFMLYVLMLNALQSKLFRFVPVFVVVFCCEKRGFRFSQQFPGKR
jgi:hypothetical protein